MTFLPIADRELRVSARNKATHRLRMTFAVSACTIAGAIGLISMASKGAFASQLGLYIFSALEWIAFIFACAAGIFLTADCLSEEKREGTLGLLFLTDLRGYDVVFGKLIATSLRSFYSLLAIFPIMAFSFFLGGVEAYDFRHTLISLCNTLFFSLALGILISALSREPQKALTGTLAVMVGFIFLIPELDFWPLGRKANNPWAGLLSPAYAFVHADSSHGADFWASTGLVHFAGWCFLGAACWLAPKSWQEKSVRPKINAGWQATKYRLMNQNPIGWIIARDRWASNLSRLALVVILAVFALAAAVSFPSGSSSATAIKPLTTGPTATIRSSPNVHRSYGVATSYGARWASGVSTTSFFRTATGCASALSLVLEFWLALQVSRFYVDGKRSGFLELLLVTPVRPKDVVHGHWLALRKLFFVPAGALLVLNLAVAAIQILLPMTSTTAGVVTISGITDMWEMQILVIILGQTAWVMGMFAIGWYSIWMGVTAKKTNVAMFKTFWYVKILPWFGATFTMAISAFLFMSALGKAGIWMITLLPTVLMIGYNLSLIRVARKKVEPALITWANSGAS